MPSSQVVTPHSDVVGYHFTLKMEAAWSFELLVSYITTWHYKTEDDNLNLYHHKNLTSHIIMPFLCSLCAYI